MPWPLGKSAEIVIGLDSQILRVRGRADQTFVGNAADPAHLAELLEQIKRTRADVAVLPSVATLISVAPSTGLVSDEDFIAVASAEAQALGIDVASYRWFLCTPSFNANALALGVDASVVAALEAACHAAAVQLERIGPALPHGPAVGARSLLVVVEENASAGWWVALHQGKQAGAGPLFGDVDGEPGAIDRIAMAAGVEVTDVLRAAAIEARLRRNLSASFNKARRDLHARRRVMAAAGLALVLAIALYARVDHERRVREAAHAERQERSRLVEQEAQRNAIEYAQRRDAIAALLALRDAPWADLLTALEELAVGGVRVEAFRFDAATSRGEVRAVRPKSTQFAAPPRVSGVRLTLQRQEWVKETVIETYLIDLEMR